MILLLHLTSGAGGSALLSGSPIGSKQMRKENYQWPSVIESITKISWRWKQRKSWQGVIMKSEKLSSYDASTLPFHLPHVASWESSMETRRRASNGHPEELFEDSYYYYRLETRHVLNYSPSKTWSIISHLFAGAASAVWQHRHEDPWTRAAQISQIRGLNVVKECQ